MTRAHRHSQSLAAGHSPDGHAANDPARPASGGSASQNLLRMEAALASIVGPRGAAAMLARSRQLCGSAAPSSAALSATLLRLTAELLGESLAQWLQAAPSGAAQRASARPSAPP